MMNDSLGDGELIKYHRNGNVRLTGRIFMSNRIGTFKEFNIEGRPTREFDYDEKGNLLRIRYIDPFNRKWWKIIENGETKYNLIEYYDLSADICNDEDFIEELRLSIVSNPKMLKYCSNALLGDRYFIYDILSIRQGFFVKNDDDLLHDGFEWISNNLLWDKNFILKASEYDQSIFKYVPDDLKKDRELILEAIEMNGFVFNYLQGELKKDREIILESLKSEGSLLELLPDNFKEDQEIVLQAISKTTEQSNYQPHQYAYPHLNETRAENIKFASQALQNDKSFILDACRCNGYVYRFLSQHFIEDKEIFFEAMKTPICRLRFWYYEMSLPIPFHFLEDMVMILSLVKYNHYILDLVPLKLKSERTFILELVKIDGELWGYAPYYSNDEEIVKTAIKTNGLALQFASNDFKYNFEIALEAINSNGLALQYVSEEFRNNKELVLQAVKSNGLALQFATKFQMDKEVILESLNSDGCALEYVVTAFMSIDEIYEYSLIAVSSNPKAFDLCEDRIKNDPEILRLSRFECNN